MNRQHAATLEYSSQRFQRCSLWEGLEKPPDVGTRELPERNTERCFRSSCRFCGAARGGRAGHGPGCARSAPGSPQRRLPLAALCTGPPGKEGQTDSKGQSLPGSSSARVPLETAEQAFEASDWKLCAVSEEVLALWGKL